MFDPERYARRLNIVVPYRDRAAHLNAFIPHMLAYFERDKLDRAIDVTISIIEQAGPARFNRGMLKNAGYDLTRKGGDYVCFHDVDYLPLWADYSWSREPARLIWHGLTLKENHENFFGGVVLLDNAVFERVNGYPNCYWGWGPEDLELGMRCRMSGFRIEKRDGTYQPLPHKHEGFAPSGGHTPEARETAAIFRTRQERLAELMQTDGLNSLGYSLLDRRNVKLGERTLKNVLHYKVRLDD